MWKFLLYGCDAAGIVAVYHIFDLLRQMKRLFLHDLTLLYDIHSYIMIDIAQNVQIQCIDITLYFDNIFLLHFIAAGIFDDSHSTIQLI